MENSKIHILVVDDDDRIRNLLKDYLADNNYIVSTAENANQAKEKLKYLKFDILILDIMMPGQDGYELTKDNKINSSEKKVLIEMLSNPGKTFSREEIGRISGITQERSIDVMITRLRQKLEANSKNPKYLQTIRGLGYVLWVE